jgi:acyl-ACP thioesterase
MDIWQETVPVRFGDIDHSDRLTLAAAFDYFQEAAINHAEMLGVGRAALEQSGEVWILSRISVQFDRRPGYHERLSVRSWPRGWEKLFAKREYDIRDEQGLPIVRGSSRWLIVDIQKRRPLRPQQYMDRLPQNEGLDALPSGGGGLSEQAGLCRYGERTARYSDIDYNGHVNNTRYIQWIQDMCEQTILANANRLRLDINYLHEVKYGETVDLLSARINDPAHEKPANALAFEGRLPGGQVAFRTELRTW